MRIGALLRLNSQPIYTAWIQGQLCETSLEKLPKYQGALVVLLPSTDILLSEVHIPSRRRQQVLLALPYSMEEQLIAAPDTLHFALGDYQNQQYQVAVCQRDYIEKNLKRLQQAGLNPDYLIPDVLAVPWIADHWSLLQLGNINLVRINHAHGFAIENNLLAIYLQQALTQHPVPSCLDIYSTDIDKLATALDPIKSANIPIKQHAHPQAAMGWFTQQLQSEPKTLQHHNLRQQQYQKYNPLKQLYQPWRVSFILVIIWGILQLGLDYINVNKQRQQQQQLKQAITQLYKQTFPDAKNIIYPKEQMQQKLKALQATDPQIKVFLPLLHRLATALKKTPQTHIQYLDYRKKYLDIQLSFKNLTELEQFKQSLKQQDLQVEIRQANSENRQVDSILRLQILKK